VAFLSSGERKRNRMVRDQVSMDAMAKRFCLGSSSWISKTFVPLKHSTAAQGFAVRLLVHVQRFASGFAYFLAELDVFPLLKLRHSRFPPLADNYPSEQ
jgi:hypothetical protein